MSVGEAAPPLYARISIDGDSHQLVIGGSTPSDRTFDSTVDTGLTVKTGIYNQAAVAKGTVLESQPIATETPVSVSIRGTDVFSGTVRAAPSGVGSRQRVEAYDALSDLKRHTVTRSYNEARPEDIARDAVESAGHTFETDVTGAPRSSPEFDTVRGDVVLERTSKWADAVWYVRADNTVVFTDNIADRTEHHEVSMLKDVSPGKRTPAYQSVLVVGSSPVSRRGRPYSNLISSEPIMATAGEGNPRFKYRDSNIVTDTMAENVASKLQKRLQMQQKGGWIETLARPDIRPFDTIELPESKGGETYLVSTVKHTITEQDGSRSRFGLGGLISP